MPTVPESASTVSNHSGTSCCAESGRFGGGCTCQPPATSQSCLTKAFGASSQPPMVDNSVRRAGHARAHARGVGKWIVRLDMGGWLAACTAAWLPSGSGNGTAGMGQASDTILCVLPICPSPGHQRRQPCSAT